MRTSVRPVASRVNASPDILDWVRGLVSLAFVLLVPMLIIGTSLRGLVTDRDLMLRGFRDNQVATTTGLDDPQLQRIADAFVAYFQGPPGQIQMQVTAFGQSRPLFNAKEVTHMEDVQRLIQFFLQMQLVAVAVVVLRVVVAVAFDRASAPIGRELLWSAALVVVGGAGRRAVADGLRRPMDAFSPDCLQKRPVAARSVEGLPDHAVPRAVLVHRDAAHGHHGGVANSGCRGCRNRAVASDSAAF